MEGKSNLFTIVLLIIIAFLTLTLAALAGYVFIGAGSSKNSNTIAKNQTSTTVQVPNDGDLALLNLYGDSSALLNLKSESLSSGNPPVIKISIELEYFKKVKGVDAENKLATYHSRIKELVSTYFQNMTPEDARNPQTKVKASKELTNKINELLNISEKKGKKTIIYDVVFDEWFYT